MKVIPKHRKFTKKQISKQVNRYKKGFKRDRVLINDVEVKGLDLRYTGNDYNDISIIKIPNKKDFNISLKAEMTNESKQSWKKALTIKYQMTGLHDDYFRKGQIFILKSGLQERKYKIISKRYYKKRKKVYLILEPMWI